MLRGTMQVQQCDFRYGPDTRVSVQVEVYVPAMAAAGIAALQAMVAV